MCVEALLRWTGDDGELVAPDQFIPIAESAGLLVEIGAWVLAQACRDLAVLRAQGDHDLRVAVNLSASQFRDPMLIASIEEALAAAGVAGRYRVNCSGCSMLYARQACSRVAV